MNKVKTGQGIYLLFRLLALAPFVISISLMMHTTVLAQTPSPSPWVFSGANITNTNNGNVGIGTAAPPQKLTIDNSVDNYMVANLRLRSLTTRYRSDFIMGSNSGLGINSYDDLAGAYLPIIIDASKTILGLKGNIGIGTTTPTEKLHLAGNGKISGNLTVDGNIAAKYQDMAEWVPSSQKLTAGTVVILDPDRSNQVIASSVSYDTRVAGVISEQPGLLLGEEGEGKVKVATTGRVKVRVDANHGPIRIGDLLVTSAREGFAMKSEPIVLQGRKIHTPGTIIGKALEPFEGGIGEIQVLLSLQ